MRAATHLQSHDPIGRIVDDQRAQADDTYQRLAHWLAEVSAEAAHESATTAAVSTEERFALDHVGVRPR
jgi:hypothetical protein